MHLSDALVVGGSFAGLSAALQLARARRRVTVVDAGAPRNRFAAASHGFFGQDGTPPLEMIATARAKLLAYPNVRFVEGRAVRAQAVDGGFAVTLDGGETLVAAKLLLAFGVADELPAGPAGLQERWGRSVVHCPYCHGYEFGGGPIGVLYVAPMSLHQALLVPDWGPTTLFLNGHDAATAIDAPMRDKLRQRGVTIEPAPLTALEGEGTALERLRLQDGRALPVRGLFVATRTRMASPLAEQLGCAFDDGPFGPVLRTDAMTKMSSVPGVYAAGDIARVPHNATFASADGVQAGASMHQSLVFGPLEG